MGKKKQSPLSVFLFIVKHAVLILYAAACLYPFLWMAGTSLKNRQEALANPATMFPSGQLHFETYAEVWGKLNFFQYFMNSMTVSTVTVAAVILLYSMMGFALARINFKGNKVVFTFFIALMLVPGLTVQIPLYLNMVALGLSNTFVGLVLPIINGSAPFAVFLFRNYFRSMSGELYEAAKIDGCSVFRIYGQIYLPLALPVIGTIAVMNFIGSWNGIRWPMIILRSREKFTLQMAVMYLDQSAFKQWNVLMAGSMFAVIPVILIFILLQKFYIQGLTSGAIKG
ncbi:MAG: carbohydrate ABC transporter permease [Treponema sp.]|jgi:ABC-type glycerol-3-phosphate transport system permease component|nr:carbohydrate ABC transporter permease [Treponema sp.]